MVWTSIIIEHKVFKKQKKIIKNLNNKGIETRPIISGNFLNQKASKIYNLKIKNQIFPNADYIDKAGFFIGLHTKQIKSKTLKYLSNELLKF